MPAVRPRPTDPGDTRAAGPSKPLRTVSERAVCLLLPLVARSGACSSTRSCPHDTHTRRSAAGASSASAARSRKPSRSPGRRWGARSCCRPYSLGTISSVSRSSQDLGHPLADPGRARASVSPPSVRPARSSVPDIVAPHPPRRRHAAGAGQRRGHRPATRPRPAPGSRHDAPRHHSHRSPTPSNHRQGVASPRPRRPEQTSGRSGAIRRDR